MEIGSQRTLMMHSRKAKTFAVHVFGAVSSILLLAPVAIAQEPHGIQAYGGYSLLHPFEGSNFDAKLRAYTFLFGPQIQKNGEKRRPFARTLFGVAHGSAKATVD